ncbi:class I SAM-dependent methyltransferase [Pseudooceanicola aestuarii]|uniref:class I SAM-dependent methyltransferase n=1 Tax=Pseudooceanicola aestuarii TaxID=2697319 RepID=UPI0013D305DB|nr:class I SAM-dependent methyltransferase [Pseudooceanicola aestuarii]
MYDDYIAILRQRAADPDDGRFAADQLLQLHAAATARPAAQILELGVDQGQSTRVFLNAIHGRTGARLVSVDIRDCAGAAHSGQWQFVQSCSADVARVLDAAPGLRAGIDILYIDSLHTREHVAREVYGYFPHLAEGAEIFFDDVDSGPYMRGARKDNRGTEIANRRIEALIREIFQANRDILDLRIDHGSTGLARLRKRAPLGATLRPPLCVAPRYRWGAPTLLRRLNPRAPTGAGPSSTPPAATLGRKFLVDLPRPGP